MSVDHYTYRVTWSQEDGEYVALCAELPSLSWLAKTPEKSSGRYAINSAPKRLPICKRMASRSLSRFQKGATAGSSASVYRPRSTARSPWKRRSRE